jgi:hypothetical protein
MKKKRLTDLQDEQTDEKEDGHGPIIDETAIVSDDIKEMLVLRFSSVAPIKRRINPLTGEPNEWILPILSKNVKGIIPEVICAGRDETCLQSFIPLVDR